MQARPLRIANAQAFWGDRNDAAALLMSQDQNLDFITLDYLAEVSLSIMAIQKVKDPSAGYARDFLEVVRSLVPFWKKGSKTRIVTNAGGLNPKACAQACRELLKAGGCVSLKVAVVDGDDVLPQLKKDPSNLLYQNLETRKPVRKVLDRLVTANAYLGAGPLVEALNAGADLVITGRVADPSLTVAPCRHHFQWGEMEYDKIAGSTMAGHLIECGTQACGGFSTDWLKVPNLDRMGFPIAEVYGDGSCILTKPKGTGGAVTVQTVKEQLLYEIGDPGKYLSPDLTVSLLSIRLKQEGKDRVRVSDAKGSAATSSYKVSATYRDGYKAHGMITIFGEKAVQKGHECGRVILKRLEKAGIKFERSLVECLGSGASAPGLFRNSDELLETVLRMSVADPNKEAVERFTKEIASLVTSGPQGTTGYSAGRPKVQAVFGYWPCLIEKNRVKPQWELLC